MLGHFKTCRDEFIVRVDFMGSYMVKYFFIAALGNTVYRYFSNQRKNTQI